MTLTPLIVEGRTATRYFGHLCMLEIGFENIRLGKESYPYKYNEDIDKYTGTKSVEVFLEAVKEHINTTNSWLDSLEE